MKILILARATSGFAEDWAVDLSASSGISCGGRSFDIDRGMGKMHRAVFINAFEQICDCLETLVEEDAEFRRYRIVVVTSQGGTSKSAVPGGLVATDYTHWSNLAALLILAFPDFLWVFSTAAAEHRAMEAADLGVHSMPTNNAARLRQIATMREIGLDPLFDPTGLRDLVKRQSYQSLGVLQTTNGIVQCPRRGQLALVIDDEIEVAAALGYLHYRQGYRVGTITTEAQLHQAASLGPFTRAAESYTIVFPDASVEARFLDPEGRTALLPALAQLNPAQRIIFTIDDVDRTQEESFRLICSPFGGMLGLGAELGLDTPPDDFVWPPANTERGFTRGRHAMPGFMTAAARRLLARAARADGPAHIGCVFALEAQELLLNRLPSLSLQAHKQRLTLELRLEGDVPTLLGGITRDPSSRLRPRFEEMNGEIESMLAVIYNPTDERRENLARTLGTQLTGAMIDEYRRGYHFHEELATIAKQRELDFGNGVFGRYGGWMLSRPGNFAISIAIWTVVFGLLYALAAATTGPTPGVETFASSLPNAMLSSAYTLVSVGAPPNEFWWMPDLGSNAWFKLLMTLECGAGLGHWGMGLAHLYTLVSRR